MLCSHRESKIETLTEADSQGHRERLGNVSVCCKHVHTQTLTHAQLAHTHTNRKILEREMKGKNTIIYINIKKKLLYTFLYLHHEN